MKKQIILGGRGVEMIATSVAQDIGTYEVLGFLNAVAPVGKEVDIYKKDKVL